MKSHCPYCALQCGIDLTGPAHAPVLAGDPGFPVNGGALCIKGWTAARLLAHPERLTAPLVRDAGGVLRSVSWEDALGRIAEAVESTRGRYGPDAVGVFGGGSLTNEKAYLLGKFARVALGTAHIDYNGRFCMSSAAAAAQPRVRHRPRPALSGRGHRRMRTPSCSSAANVAETMPPIMRYFEAQREAAGTLIVVDPRRTPTAAGATLHLAAQAPGTDAGARQRPPARAGARGPDRRSLRPATNGGVRRALRAIAAAYWPDRVERITGVPEARGRRGRADARAGAQRR